MTQTLPLAGYRVVDLADEKGELAGRILADFGAEVIRVEPPSGARSRALPPFAPSGESLYFAYRNSNKLGHVLDLESEAGKAELLDLLARADLLIESEAPGRMAALGLAPETLSTRFPHLVVLSISDFGQTGPYRDWVATDATMCSISGMQFKAGVQGREPLLTPGAMVYDIAGVMGAFASMTALYQRQRTGYGQTLDLSVLEAVAQQTDWSLSNGSMTDAKLQETPQTRFGSGPMYRIFPCKGGFVRLVILSPRQWHAMRAWLGEPDYLQDKKYDSFLGRMEIAEALNVVIGDLFSTMTHEEVAFEAQKRGIVCTPVLAPGEVLENVHFRSRKTFLDAEYAPGEKGPIASGYFELDRERQGFRTRAPKKGEHSAKIRAGIWPDFRAKPVHPRPAPSRPFENLRVLDFGIGGVGVEAARLFAEYGADVIKVESKTYPDFIRIVMSTPLSGSFASSSRSKRGLGINLKLDEGRRLLHELARHSDVVTENGSTGTMDSLGVGYEALSKTNPRIVLASSQLLGDHGAWADWIGYGPSTQPIGGLVHLWDYEQGDEPAGSTSIFPDHLAGRLLALSALAALFRRAKTGRGGHACVAQAEAVANILGDLLLKEGIAPGTVKPRGNRNDRGAPWGTYPCAGADQWVTITIRDDADWGRFKMAIGDPDWTKDPRYATAAGRRAAQDELDAKLVEWTKTKTKLGVTAILQLFKVPCAPMFTARDQLHDPHYQSRGYMRWLDQQVIGWMAMEGPCFRASGMSDVNLFQAPLVGEHTRAIARDVLGLSDAEIQRQIDAGVLESQT